MHTDMYRYAHRHTLTWVTALLDKFLYYAIQKGKKDKEKKSEKKSKKPIVTEPEPPEHNLLGDLVSLDSPSQSLQPNIMGLETMQVCIVHVVCSHVCARACVCVVCVFSFV